MNHSFIDITGLGSVGPCGPVSGPLRGVPSPSVVTAWPTAGPRYALPALPFRTAEVLPKVNTRRLDRLSTWSLAAAALALRDADLDLSAVDGSRTAVVSAIGLGCLDLTEAYLRSAHEYGWQQTDPIYFPETLGNVPAAHVARVFGCLGPNLTVGSRGPAAETALLTAASLLRVGQADRVLVLAGDLLTRGLFDWYEAAGLLSADEGGFVPSEGMAAMVLEAPGRYRARARLMDTWWVQTHTASMVGRTPWSADNAPVGPRDEGVPRGPGGPPHHSWDDDAGLRDEGVRPQRGPQDQGGPPHHSWDAAAPPGYPECGSEGASEPRQLVAGEKYSSQAEALAPPTASGFSAMVGHASACQRPLADATLVCKNQSVPAGLREALSPPVRFAPACATGDGLPDTGGLFRILTALATAAPGERLLVLGAAPSGSHAAAMLEVAAND